MTYPFISVSSLEFVGFLQMIQFIMENAHYLIAHYHRGIIREIRVDDKKPIRTRISRNDDSRDHLRTCRHR